MKHVLLAVVAAVAAAALVPATAGAATVRGVVVSRSHGMMFVATRTGRVVGVKGHAAVGSRVVGSRVVGRASRARIHGIVVMAKRSTLFVSSNRHLVAIHTGRSLADNGGQTGTAPGTVVTTTVGLQNGQLNEQHQTDNGQSSATVIPVQATVTAVGAGTVTLTVNGVSVTLNLPAGLTLPSSIVGQMVTINVTIAQQGQGDNDADDQGGGGSGGGDGGGGDGGGGGGGGWGH